MAVCKRRVRVTTISVVAGGGLESLRLAPSTAEFMLRARTAVGYTMRIGSPTSEPMSFAAGDVFTEDRLQLDAELVLFFDAGADVVIEALIWEG